MNIIWFLKSEAMSFRTNFGVESPRKDWASHLSRECVSDILLVVEVINMKCLLVIFVLIDVCTAENIFFEIWSPIELHMWVSAALNHGRAAFITYGIPCRTPPAWKCEKRWKFWHNPCLCVDLLRAQFFFPAWSDRVSIYLRRWEFRPDCKYAIPSTASMWLIRE